MSEMNENKSLSCAVARDLMPLYVEELTGEETNQQIAGHIASCPVCAQALGMQQARLNIEKNGKKRDVNGIRFLKKQAVCFMTSRAIKNTSLTTMYSAAVLL